MLLHAVIPRFLRTLEDVHIKENADAHFSCEIYPDDIPVKWYINRAQIKPSSKYSMPIKGPERHLHIKAATKADEGHVSVMIDDELKSSADLSVEGTFTHCSCFNPPSNLLRVTPKYIGRYRGHVVGQCCVFLHAVIPRILQVLEDIQIKENEDAHFSCEVYPDDIPVKWYINRTQIKPSNKYSMPHKGPERHLHVKGATKADEGRVSVRIDEYVKSSADLSVEGTLIDRYGCNPPSSRNLSCAC